MEILLFIGIAAVVIAVAVLGVIYERKRRDAFKKLAARLGMEYTAKDRTRIPSEFKYLDGLRKGSNRYAYNILRGPHKGHEALAFDYHYETYSTDSKGRRQTQHHRLSYFILIQEKAFPEVRIYPETFLSKLGQFMGYEDIDFDSVEFSKAFTVRSKDRKTAYDICNALMMSYLLDHRDLSLELDGVAIGIGFASRLKPEDIESRLDQIVHIRGLIPDYVYDS